MAVFHAACPQGLSVQSNTAQLGRVLSQPRLDPILKDLLQSLPIQKAKQTGKGRRAWHAFSTITQDRRYQSGQATLYSHDDVLKELFPDGIPETEDKDA